MKWKINRVHYLWFWHRLDVTAKPEQDVTGFETGQVITVLERRES